MCSAVIGIANRSSGGFGLGESSGNGAAKRVQMLHCGPTEQNYISQFFC